MSIETGITVSPVAVPASTGANEIVFVENNLQDLQAVLAGLRPGVEVVLLDSAGDGVAQMADALRGRSGIDAIHIVSHGAPGALDLGSTSLSAATLGAHADALGAIGASLAAGGDILLYGCETAAGSGGAALLNGLASLTQADIAASTGLTGAAAQGGDWVLEQHTGEIGAQLCFSDAFTAQYGQLLVNARPTLGYISVILGGREDTPGVVTFADLLAAADEADIDGTVVAFVVRGFYSGGTTFKIGTSLETATSQLGNETIDATRSLYYTPPADYNSGPGGGIGMIEVMVVDDMGATSTTTATVYVNLAPVNDAPKFNYLTGTTMNAVMEDVVSLDHEDVSNPSRPPANRGTDIANLIQWSAYEDKEHSSAAGVAVSGNAANPLTQGRWQYSTDGNAEFWHDIGTVSASSALLLRGGAGATYLRFVPVAEFSGAPGPLSVHAIDGSNPSLQFSTWDGTTEVRRTFDTTADDDTSPVSAVAVPWKTSVIAVNDIPVFTGLGSADNQSVFSTDAAVLVDATQDIALADVDSPDFTSGYVSVAIASGRGTGDVLAIRTDSEVSLSAGMSFNSAISVGGVVVGTIAYGSTGLNQDLAIYLSSGANPANVATLLRHITFDTTGSVAGDRSISMLVRDGDNGTSATGTAVVSVVVPATVAITSDRPTLKVGQTATITFTFNEAPTGFDIGDVTVTGGDLSGLAQNGVNPKVYTALYTPTADQQSTSGSVSIAAGKFTSALGTPNMASTGNAPMTVDTVAPTLAVSADKTTVKAGDVVGLTFTFNETPTGFTAGDVGASGGTISGFTATADSKVYTASFTPFSNYDTVNGSVVVSAGRYTDAAGNSGAAGNTISINGDTRAPGVTITADKTAVKAGDTVDLTLTFTETPNGLSADDLSVTGGAVTKFQATANSKVYTATFTPDASDTMAGTVRIGAGAYTDAAANAGKASNLLAISGDTRAPTVVIGSSAASLKAGETADISFSFSEAPAGFDAADVQVSGGTLGPVTVSTADPKIYTASFTPTPGIGSVGAAISVAGGSYADGAANAGAAGQLAIMVDTLAPSLTISSDKSVLRAGETATVRFSFSEAPLHFDAADLAVSGGTLGAITVTADPTVYTAVFTPNATDTLSGAVGLATVRYTDAAGNPGAPAAAIGFSGDTLAPTLAISADKTSLHAGESATLTLTFSEAPTGFGAGDIDHAGGALSKFTATSDPRVFSATFTPDASDNLNAWVSVSAGAWSDAGGNVGGASKLLSLGGDTLAPTVTGIAPAGTPAANATAVEFSVTLSESVTGVDAGDFALTGSGGTVGRIASVTGSGASYTVKVDGIAGNGTLRLDLNGNNTGIADHAGNAAGGYGAGSVHTASFNTAPEIGSNMGGASAAIGIAEGSTRVTTVAASDADHDTLTYSIGGGADAALFQIDAATGVLALRSAQRHAAPADSDHDGRYEVQVAASDNKGGSDTQALTVTVLQDLDGDGVADVDDTDLDNDGRANAIEDAVRGAHGGHGDGNGDGRPDGNQLNVASLPTAVAGNPYATLEVADGLTLTAVSAAPAPQGLPRNVKLPLGVLDFTIGGVGVGGTATVSIYVDSALQANGYFKQDNSGKWVNIARSVTTVGSKTKISFDLTDGGIFDNDGAANGSILDPGGAALIAPLITSDGGAPQASLAVAEGTLAVTTAAASAAGPLTWSLGGADAALFEIDAGGALRFRAAPDFGAPLDSGATPRDNVYVVDVVATDGNGSDTQTLNVSVQDVAEPPAVPVPVLVDGVPVTTGTAVNGDGSVSQVITIPVVVATRTEQVGNNAVADIPLAGDAGQASLSAQVPTGLGLQVSGSATARTAGASLADLIREIKAHTASGSHDQDSLAGGGAGFLADLPASTALFVKTIVASADPALQAPAAPLVIQGMPAAAGAPMTALVIDTQGLPGGSTIQLQNVEFAAVIGAVTVNGGDGAQNVWGDSAAQTIFLGADDDVLHGGAGNDTVGSAGGNDRIYGDEGDDIVFGGAGNDTIDGGSGTDTVLLAGAGRAEYTMRIQNGALVMTHLNGADGTDVVTGVETLRYGGQTVGADFNRGEIADLVRLYSSAFGRAADTDGINFWIGAYEGGVSVAGLADALMASAEADASFGGLSNARFVGKLYEVAMGRSASAQEVAYWTGHLDGGVLDRGDALLNFALSDEKVGLVGVVTTSIETI